MSDTVTGPVPPAEVGPGSGTAAVFPARVDTDLLPPDLRLDFWREVVGRNLAPVEVLAKPDGFRGLIEARDLGAVDVSSLSSTECTGVRTAKMIRQGDPEVLQLAFNINSRVTVQQERGESVAGPAEFTLYSTSRPYVIHSTAGPGLVRGIMVLLPRTLLPVPARKIERLAPAVFSARSGIGALLANYLTGLMNDDTPYSPADAVRLGGVVVDLLGALLASRVEETRTVPPESRNSVLLLRVHAFIEERLEDPLLTPATVAAAHHISLRALHRLFEGREVGVAAWIRHRRLERCRRDLTDPALRDYPVQSVAARYGFVSAAHFSRAFRAAYGMSPQEYRSVAGLPLAAPRSRVPAWKRPEPGWPPAGDQGARI